MFKIFVGNLNYKTTDVTLRELFGKHFVVEDCVMATDPKTNEPRGFAIVMTRDEVKGRAALETMRGIRLDGRLLIINEAGAKKKGGPPGPGGPRGPRSGPPSGVSHRPPGRSFRASSRPPGGGFRSGPPRRSHDDRSGGSGPGQSPPPPSRG